MDLLNFRSYLLYGKYVLAIFLLWDCMSPIKNLPCILLASVTAILVLLMLHNGQSLCNLGVNVSMLCYVYLVGCDIIRSSFRLTALIWSKDVKPDPTAEWVHHANFLHSTKNAVLHANAITMTPGTFVIAVDMAKRKLLVHTLFRPLISGLPDSKLLKVLRNDD